ncbi:germination protein YpeB [Baia soyae]|uniref:Spore germination protein n=1 Tax=Baia soyae TaxID=1544746 RepID=A0A4R2RYN1_9BACL|nr:germination protein YpeB [Baia soyae]TCP69846.1 spore germination protein [Baia soyae]
MSTYGKIARVFLPITLVVLLGMGAWAYKEYQEKSSVLIKAENQYQRAFHELNNHMDALQGEIGKVLAVNSQKHLSDSLTNVWRLTYAAQSDVAQLPLSLMPFHDTQKFLGRMGTFSYHAGVRDFNKEPLSEKEYQTLNTLYQNATDIKGKLNEVQSQVISKNLRWMDVELAIATEDKKLDHTIIDGFQAVNNMVVQFPEVDWGPTVNNLEVRKKEKFTTLKGRNISEEEAKEKAAKLLDRTTEGMKVTFAEKGDFPVYSISFEGKNGPCNLDLTRTEGHVTWMLYNRPVKESKLSREQALEKAQSFLKKMGYEGMVPISHIDEDHILTLSMVHKEGNILIYPEALALKIALDNGEIIGIQADEYVFNRKERVFEKPTLTHEQARKQVNPHLKVTGTNQAYIYGEDGKEALCYEFLGTLKDNQYRIFINGDTGEEEFVEKIEKEEPEKI